MRSSVPTPAPRRAGPPTAPPGPPGRPVVGHLPEFSRDLLGFLTTCARGHGDVVAFRVAGWRTYLLSHPDDIERVLVTEQRNFPKNRFFWRHVDALLGDGLLTSHGDHWLRQRRLAQPAFHRERVAGYAERMVACTEAMLAGWAAGDERDVHADLMHLTLRIVAGALFDADDAAVDDDAAEISAALDVLSRELAARLRRPVRIPDAIPLPGNVRYLRAVRRVDAVVHRLIREHRERERLGRAGTDLLDLLMRARGEDGEAMTDAELRDEAITIMLAGHETTALALSWAFHLLGRTPEADAALARELAEVLGPPDAARPPTVDDLPRLRYAEAVITESMRLHPPAYLIGREAATRCTIGGYEIPAGATLFLSPWVVHRDARWFERPDAFRPERWVDGTLARALPRFAYFPFGGGPRVCIGNRFAMTEAVLVLATIARRWRLAVPADAAVGMLAGITLRPVPGIAVSLVPR